MYKAAAKRQKSKLKVKVKAEGAAALKVLKKLGVRDGVSDANAS